MGDFHQYSALVGALPLRDGVHPLCRCAKVLPAPCRTPYSDIWGNRRSSVAFRGDVQGDADVHDHSRHPSHNRGSGADLVEPSVEFSS